MEEAAAEGTWRQVNTCASGIKKGRIIPPFASPRGVRLSDV